MEPAPNDDVVLKKLEESIAGALWNIHDLEQTVQDFAQEAQPVLFDRVNRLVDSLTDLKGGAMESSLEIPVELLRMLDEGVNPDLLTLSRFEKCLERNQATKGKLTAIEGFHDKLLEEAKEAFPEEASQYLQLRDAENPGTGESVVTDPPVK
ncbi:hypothetical protein CYMTET_18941 [Cymbomonas tetramitiformis]|uniref:Mediator of RNA polymerase II transcription subunit 10 n=1 Tax=Cymbomonas tetramitiformis TaxID=36881 RepID=A0AAE0L5R5_9CHLO|nr:hypothetical protein CYMTET_18941 [Cymbomonas tetramitiformis]